MDTLIPVCADDMSAYTYTVVWAIVTAMGIGFTTLYWWTKREINRETEQINKKITEHDVFCADTNGKLTDIQISVSAVKENITGLNHSYGELATLNRDVIKFMMEKK